MGRTLELHQVPKLTGHDEDIALIFQYLKQLLTPPQTPGVKLASEEKMKMINKPLPER